MSRNVYPDSLGWLACMFSIIALLCTGNVTANKESYYGKYIGKLSQLHHGVSGDVFAVDARTLHIRNFNYDGEGPAAYFYAGNSKAPGANGFRLRDERGTTNVLPRYRNKHITVTLPEGKTLQNIRWFSVWCDEFSVNFGDVKIPKNLDFPKPQKISGLSGVHGVSSEPIVIVDAQTLLIPSFSYDGEAPDAKFWVGRGFKPSPQGIRIPDENGKELPLRRYDRKTIVLTLPGDLTIFDIGHFGVWCEAFTVDFGHVQIPRGLNIPPSLKMLGVSPQSKLNCEVLWDDFAFEVRWAVAGDSIVLQLVARLENDEYMSFGLSGDNSRSRMVGGDVVVAWVDKDSLKGYAKDYYLDAKSQCSGGRGSCPDENIEAGSDSVRLLNAALVNGYSIVTFQRSLKAQDDLDKDVLTNSSQPIIWAVGPLNSRREVSYHSLANRGDIYIDFGRAPKWNCPTPESVSDQGESEEPSIGEQDEVRIEDPKRRESRPKTQLPTPAPAPKTGAWEIPAIKCYEPEDGVFYAQMGPTGGKHGYSAITGHVGWGISWYINGLLIPEINVVRGRTYTFIVEGGLDPEIPARYHPFYITDDPVGGYQYKTPQERANIQIFAGAVQNKKGEVRPTGVGRLCNWTPDPSSPPADDFSSFGAYQRTLRLECDPGNPGIIQWTVEKDTPDTVYYQCYTHRYLGWKINVHDHCEGEAGTNPVPSVIKAPASVSKYYEEDSDGSESINFETRIKPDAELLKNILEKNRTHFEFNQLAHEGTSKGEGPFLGLQKYSQIKVGPPPQPAVVFPSLFPPAQTPVKFPHKSSGYSVTEEPSEGIHQNFQIIPLDLPQFVQPVNGLQKHHPEESFRMPVQEHSRSQESLEMSAEEERHRKNHKSPYQTKLKGNSFGPIRLRKPQPPSSVTLQQRPFPLGAYRPPVMPQKQQKRPSTINSYKGHNFQAKFPQSLHRVNIALGPEDFNRKETQLNRQIKRPMSQKHETLAIGHLDLFGSSTISKQTSQVTPFAQNNGFDPHSVQVEGGFKPILNSGIAPNSKSVLTKRTDLEVPENTDDKVGAIELGALVIESQESSTAHKNLRELEKNGDEEDFFKNQKPQAFEPIFVPSHPDDSQKKYAEKSKKKNLINLKPRYDRFRPKEPQRSEEILMKVIPSASIVRRPLYPDNAAQSFRMSQQGRMPQLRSQEANTAKDDFVNGHARAENILQVLELSEGSKNRSESTISTANQDTIEGVLKEAEVVEDEMAVANERKEFYLPPKADRFLSYDGKVVKAVEAPVLPEANPPTDFSKLPQFVPFKGSVPPLHQTVDAESLPQLRSSKLARQDILPSATPVVKGVFPPKISATFQTPRTQKRRKRSPDHIPGHQGHDHHDHQDHHHGNSASSIASNLFLIALVFFPLPYWQRYIP